MVEQNKPTLPDPQVPDYEEIQNRFYGETDRLVNKSKND
jgi:hypothetical protein